jgi:hypothetical protein
MPAVPRLRKTPSVHDAHNKCADNATSESMNKYKRDSTIRVEDGVFGWPYIFVICATAVLATLGIVIRLLGRYNDEAEKVGTTDNKNVGPARWVTVNGTDTVSETQGYQG